MPPHGHGKLLSLEKDVTGTSPPDPHYGNRSPARSSATPSGCTTCPASVCAMSNSSWRNAVSSSPTRRCDAGATNSARGSLTVCEVADHAINGIRIHGVQHYLWRAVDQDRVALDIMVRAQRNDQKSAASPCALRDLLARLRCPAPGNVHSNGSLTGTLRRPSPAHSRSACPS
jgi:hypothetical protein